MKDNGMAKDGNNEVLEGKLHLSSTSKQRPTEKNDSFDKVLNLSGNKKNNVKETVSLVNQKNPDDKISFDKSKFFKPRDKDAEIDCSEKISIKETYQPTPDDYRLKPMAKKPLIKETYNERTL